MNLVLRLIFAMTAIVVLAAAFFFGLVVLIVVITVFASFVVLLYLRSWWLGRATVTKARVESDDKVIDAEYKVVSRRRN